MGFRQSPRRIPTWIRTGIKAELSLGSSVKIASASEVGLRFNIVKARTDYDMFSDVDDDTFESDTDTISAYLRTSVINGLFSTFEVSHSNLTYRDLKTDN